MVASSFPWFRQSSRDNPDPRVALRVDDGKQVVLDHPEQDIAILAVSRRLSSRTTAKGSSKARRAASKTYAVPGQISGRLVAKMPMQS
jgi:spermidine synthase